ncbi:MAG: hypothetical protein AAGA71_09860 [Pseudomonadota bacterium]
MDGLNLTKTRLRAGIWEGRLSGAPHDAGPPALAAYHLEAALPDLTVEPVAETTDTWAVRIPLPSTILSEGVQTVLVHHEPSAETLAVITLVAGTPLEEDLAAEIALLRAELDMLKRAFRRHCVETA